jgi:membrane-bound ClpP family serine protease
VPVLRLASFLRYTALILFLGIAGKAVASAAAETPVSANPSTEKAVVDANSEKGKNPFTLNVTIGFPANISEKRTPPPPTLRSDSGAQAYKARIYEYAANAELSSNAAWHHTRAALNQAMNMDVDMVYIHLNAFADFNTTTTDIRNKLSESTKPMTVFLDRGDNTSGAMISVSGDSLGKPHQTLQTKTAVVKLNKNQLQEKYKTCVNSLVQNKVASGTAQAPQTTENLFSSYTAGKKNDASLAAVTPTKSASILFYNYQASSFDRLLDFLLHPWISLLLILIMLGGIVFEIRKPGTGFPAFIAVAAALLLFVPLYMEGMTKGGELFLFLAGICGFVFLERTGRKSFFLVLITLLVIWVGLVLCLTPGFGQNEFIHTLIQIRSSLLLSFPGLILLFFFSAGKGFSWYKKILSRAFMSWKEPAFRPGK